MNEPNQKQPIQKLMDNPWLLLALGILIPFLSYTGGDAPRGVVFAPDTPATRRAGIAGALFVATINGGAWQVNDVVQISGPFDDHIRQRAAAP